MAGAAAGSVPGWSWVMVVLTVGATFLGCWKVWSPSLSCLPTPSSPLPAAAAISPRFPHPTYRSSAALPKSALRASKSSATQVVAADWVPGGGSDMTCPPPATSAPARCMHVGGLSSLGLSSTNIRWPYLVGLLYLHIALFVAQHATPAMQVHVARAHGHDARAY